MRHGSSLPSPTHALPSSQKLLELKEISIKEIAAIEHCLWLLLQQQEELPLSEVALKESAESLGLSIVDKKKQSMPASISLSELTE
jgi:hypothetical protein